MASNPTESAPVASLQEQLFHWKTFPTAAGTQMEQALRDWFAEDAIAIARFSNDKKTPLVLKVNDPHFHFQW